MYTTTGGGVVGAGASEAVVAKGHALLTALQRQIEVFPVDERVNLPPVDLVQITLITSTGRRRASVPAAAFWGQEPSTVIDLIAAIHDLLSVISAAGSPA
jgi:hypothetical protein